MKRITKLKFTNTEREALQKVIKSEISLREAAQEMKCSYEQVRLILGQILKQGFEEGWIKVDFNKL